ncbi:glutathione S-transferase family protein [Pseudaestuariivita atlantica]|uniref:Glutathione S-transferase n=1 Tax=Pseudaestuariivita atlantica TaxID=1317121 RepID=A0A0L1JUM5_9RHOB|nr:glutathione S-transferase family protein [Pseudaestuariivita atlantica]KNG95113.1 hypothetical protein ATO11_00190 [Pseudaestuariivita atlantica]
MPQITPQDPGIAGLSGRHLWHAPMSSCSQRVRIALAETGADWHSHVINLGRDEHASAAYQAIHPQGLVPAYAEDGRLFIDSVDIIAEVAPDLATDGIEDLLSLADAAQADLKLLSHEFLFRARPAPTPEKAEAFQKDHRNATLTRFKRDWAAGFAPERINAAVARTDAGFWTLEERLSDGRSFLGGETFSLADIAWMPNLHRMRLMDWPFGRYAHLPAWFERVTRRESFTSGLMDWQPEGEPALFAAYTAERRAAGSDVTSVPHFRGLG